MSKIMRQVQREMKKHRKDFEDQRTLEVAVLAQVLGEAMSGRRYGRTDMGR